MRIGTTTTPGGAHVSFWVRVSWDGTRLSFVGAEGPTRNGGCVGSLGQCPKVLGRIYRFGPWWNEERAAYLSALWDEWHFNDVQASCFHQRTLGWTWKTHPMQPCPVCGYVLGSKWNRREVPQEVLLAISELPDADRPCPWSDL